MLVHDNLKENLQTLKTNGFEFIVKTQDKSLSKWNNAKNGKHIQLIACYNRDELNLLLDDLYRDRNYIYIHIYKISNVNNNKLNENAYKNIANVIRHYSWTLRDDWIRHLRISTK